MRYVEKRRRLATPNLFFFNSRGINVLPHNALHHHVSRNPHFLAIGDFLMNHVTNRREPMMEFQMAKEPTTIEKIKKLRAANAEALAKTNEDRPRLSVRARRAVVPNH